MFEIHATVESNELESFKKDCVEFGCKPILIELVNQDYKDNQLMTSQKFSHNNWELEVDNIKEKLISKNYNILRIKVEELPVPGNDYKYLETHVRVKANEASEFYLDNIAKKHHFHKSRNVFKKIDDNNFYIMCTYRTKNSCLQKFKHAISLFTKEISDNGFEYDKLEIEGCVMDTNEILDKSWLN